MLRIADGAPVPSNQRPLRITVSKFMGMFLWSGRLVGSQNAAATTPKS
jgi:hypothetical protein